MDKEDRYKLEAKAAMLLALKHIDQAAWRYSYCEMYTEKTHCEALLSIINGLFPDPMAPEDLEG